MDINLELYKVFYYVSTTLSFSEASRQLFISQSAVSQSVKTLEKKLNQTLRQREIDFAQVALYSNAVEKMLNVLGIVVDKPVIGEAEKEVFAKWNQAKADKDFDTADKYRNELAEKGLL